MFNQNINIGKIKAHMTKDENITSFKYSILQHAHKNKSIISFCKVFNLSRTTYYEWLGRFNQFGYLGLLDRKDPH